MFRTIICALLCISAVRAAPLARHVVVIALDGARPELVREHSTGALRMIVTQGAHSWTAEAAVPSVTHVNFAGIFTSSRPEKHGINQLAWNRGVVLKVKATTIFEILAAHDRTGVAFLGHEKLYPSEKPAKGIHFEHSPHGAKQAAPLAARWIRQHQPAFTFVYFGNLDGAGHTHGWMSPEQIATMSEINRGVDLIFAAVHETAMKDQTVIIVTSDHGGQGKSHGQGRIEDRIIPWVCWGPGVVAGKKITDPVFNYDTAATALYVLGLPRPAEWDGRPVSGAFAARP